MRLSFLMKQMYMWTTVLSCLVYLFFCIIIIIACVTLESLRTHAEQKAVCCSVLCSVTFFILSYWPTLVIWALNFGQGPIWRLCYDNGILCNSVQYELMHGLKMWDYAPRSHVSDISDQTSIQRFSKTAVTAFNLAPTSTLSLFCSPSA